MGQRRRLGSAAVSVAQIRERSTAQWRLRLGDRWTWLGVRIVRTRRGRVSANLCAGLGLPAISVRSLRARGRTSKGAARVGDLDEGALPAQISYAGEVVPRASSPPGRPGRPAGVGRSPARMIGGNLRASARRARRERTAAANCRCRPGSLSGMMRACLDGSFSSTMGAPRSGSRIWAFEIRVPVDGGSPRPLPPLTLGSGRRGGARFSRARAMIRQSNDEHLAKTGRPIPRRRRRWSRACPARSPTARPRSRAPPPSSAAGSRARRRRSSPSRRRRKTSSRSTDATSEPES